MQQPDDNKRRANRKQGARPKLDDKKEIGKRISPSETL